MKIDVTFIGDYFVLVLFFSEFRYTIIRKHSKFGLKLFIFSYDTKADCSGKSYNVLVHFNL